MIVDNNSDDTGIVRQWPKIQWENDGQICTQLVCLGVQEKTEVSLLHPEGYTRAGGQRVVVG